MSSEKPQSFEANFARLEEILTKMNSSEVALEESLQLFEEADGLIRQCGKKLQGAKQKVETLIKDRNGQLQTTNSGQVETTPFNS